MFFPITGHLLSVNLKNPLSTNWVTFCCATPWMVLLKNHVQWHCSTFKMATLSSFFFKSLDRMRWNLNKNVHGWSFSEIVSVDPVHFPTWPLQSNAISHVVLTSLVSDCRLSSVSNNYMYMIINNFISDRPWIWDIAHKELPDCNGNMWCPSWQLNF